MDAALRAAVQQLRQKERVRRKQGVRLLFDRVANNIRTRNLLKRNVYQGEAFASYVGVLYSNWRAKLEDERRSLHAAQDTQRGAVFSLLQLQPSSPGATLTKPTAAPVHPSQKAKAPSRGPRGLLSKASTKSSFHFDRANFAPNS